MALPNPFAIGFALVAASIVVGVDFATQAQRQDVAIQAFTKDAYLGTLERRVQGTVDWVEKKQVQSVSARDHLPEAPEGWTREAWDVESINLDDLTRGMHMLEKSRAKKEHIAARLVADDQVWQYRHGNEIVRIFVRFDREKYVPKVPISGWLTERFAPLKKPKYLPYAVVQGVPFLKIESGRGADVGQPLMLEAVLGDNVTLAVAGQATRVTVLELIEQINFDALNAMLDHSLRPVGSGAPELTEVKAMTLARLHARARNAGIELSLAEMNATLISKVEDWDAFLAERGLADGGSNRNVAAGVVNAVSQNIDNVTESNARPSGKQGVSRLQLSGGRTCIGQTSRLCH
ncbi:MAG: hypothetical protein AAGL92_06500 [Pseudomonadota bacterium]